MVSLQTKIENTPKISRRIIPALKRLGIRTIRDLLFYFPARYEDFSNIKKVRELKIGETVTVRGEIIKSTNRRTKRKGMVITEVSVHDGTGAIKAIWFNQPFMMRNLKVGEIFSLSGKVALGPEGMYLQNPAYEKASSLLSQVRLVQGCKLQASLSTGIHTGTLVPIYPETRGITSRWIRYLIKNFIELSTGLRDPLPLETRRKYLFPEIKEALREIHFPSSYESAEQAKRRFSFEELLLIQLRALRERLKLKKQSAPIIPPDISLIKEFVRSLPYELTNAQRRSIWEILQDISKPRPMNRLLEGDVGSGKTVVATAAALLTAKAGYKTVFMAPTEILARQHFDTVAKLLRPFKVEVGILIGGKKESTDAPVVIGTQALIQDKVRFYNLGLVVVDEQHRFGVEQRRRLMQAAAPLRRESVCLPHFLSMSATPIPRTLALTIYGDLDLSILDEMPKYRKPVVTRIVEPQKRDEAYQFIREEVKRGRQVFVVCPRIDAPPLNAESTGINVEVFPHESTLFLRKSALLEETKAVKEEYKKLKEEIFPDLKVWMLHGKMKSKEKNAVMRKFERGEIDILVTTSVVEVGVDIPNATIMMIEGAERFGLAQLHQFRGRVGRGGEQSYCFLFPSEDGIVTKRLRALVEAKNGFELAEKDLEIRGPGDIFGTRQWGVSNDLMRAVRDVKLVRNVRREAVEILQKDPELRSYSALRERLEEKERTVHLE